MRQQFEVEYINALEVGFLVSIKAPIGDNDVIEYRDMTPGITPEHVMRKADAMAKRLNERLADLRASKVWSPRGIQEVVV